jgi:spore coat protein U-like protein
LNYRLEVNDGTHATEEVRTGAVRRLRQPIATTIWRDAGFTQIWGTQTPQTSTERSTSALPLGQFHRSVLHALAGTSGGGSGGTYTDTVTLTMFIPGPNPTTTIPITVITTNSCQISVAPGDVNFTYTSFQPGPAAASTIYGSAAQPRFPTP